MVDEINEFWEPELLKREVLKTGIWYYDDTIPYKIEIVKHIWNYTKADIEKYEDVMNPYVWQDLTHVNNEGEGTQRGQPLKG